MDQKEKNKNTTNNGLLSMPPNSQPPNLTHGGTAASQTVGKKIQKED